MRRSSFSEALHGLTEMMAAKNLQLLEHGRRTALYALTLGHAVGVSTRDMIDLHYAALLHDIGQTRLPDEILQKKGPLTYEEYALIQCHPRDGAKFVEAIPALRGAAVLVAHHHEHWDGSGYPYGLRGAFIPLGSRILAVADRFDALCSVKDGFGRDARLAMRRLRRLAGSQLDPALVGIFVQRMENERNRPSCCVEMSDGGFGAGVPLAPTG